MCRLYLPDCCYSLKLLDKLHCIATQKNILFDFVLIERAIIFAKKYHESQMRKTGEPFYSHPLEVAYMVADYLPKTDVIVASILHDVVEDTEVTIDMIIDNFSLRIAEMVDRLTRDRPDGTKLSVEVILSSSYLIKDKEVMLIKLFDRLHNIQTIGAKSSEKAKKTINETLKNFLVLSEIMEMPVLSEALYNLCYHANVELGIITESDFILDKPFNLEEIFLVPENKIH